jgi:hypothetical protein
MRPQGCRGRCYEAQKEFVSARRNRRHATGARAQTRTASTTSIFDAHQELQNQNVASAARIGVRKSCLMAHKVGNEREYRDLPGVRIDLYLQE